MRIVIAGGSGFLGTALGASLRVDGHHVAVLTRRPRTPEDVQWDPDDPDGAWTQALDGATAVVNLAGESIAGRRWTAARKTLLRESRVRTTRALVTAMQRADRPPAALINGSAIGIYGPHGDEPVTEDTPPGSDFLSILAREWEAEALGAPQATRVVLLRTGIVLDPRAGALPQMALPFTFFAGGPLGSGRQYMSWIHVEDWVALARWAIATATVSGPLNATAPEPVTNRELAKTLGRVLGRPALMPAPAFALKLILGEMSEMLLAGQRVLPAKALAGGFTFRYPTLEPALRALYRRGT